MSCTGNHLHDGSYRANVFTDASLSWVITEELKIEGNDLYYTSRSAFDKKVFEEIKLECSQYPDRIEYKDKNGLTRILRFTEKGSLKYGEYTYEKFNPDSGGLNIDDQKKSQPLIKKNKNGKITILPRQKD